jgi:error-prone DNA polymerase
LGLRYVAGLRQAAGEQIVAQRERAPFSTLQDFVDRAALHRDELQALAELGALNTIGVLGRTRRSALWQVERACRPRGPLLRAAVEEEPDGASPLPEMGLGDRLASDLAGSGMTVGPHPMALYRRELAARGVRRAGELGALADGSRVTVAGAVICRQRPGTAQGFMFLTLEDESGLANVIVRPDLFDRRSGVLVSAGVLEVSGVLQAREGVSVRAFEVRALGEAPDLRYSRDFR